MSTVWSIVHKYDRSIKIVSGKALTLANRTREKIGEGDGKPTLPSKKEAGSRIKSPQPVKKQRSLYGKAQVWKGDMTRKKTKKALPGLGNTLNISYLYP